MSDFSLPGYESVQPESKKKAGSEEFKLRVIKFIFIILCFFLVIEAITYKTILPAMKSPRIVYSGLSLYTEHDMLQLLSAMNTQSWLEFDSTRAVSILSAESGIESVSVAKHFPDTITITIVERKPVALTFLTDAQKSIPVQIDKNGVLFLVRNGSHAFDKSIPIVSGLPIEHFSDGMRIPVKYRGLIDRIAEIRGLQQKYLAAVSEICVVPKEYGNYELVLFPANSRVRVLTDRALNEEALQYMMVVLDVVKSIDPGVSEIDLRYGSVSYRSGIDWRRS